MSSFRQIEANRRNARLSTGPRTEDGKRRSRRNAVRHGLTAETVIDALEDADDYAAFELAVTSDYEARTAVERELVLRLASLLWRLRRATAIESGLFKIQALHLLQFRRNRKMREPQKSADNLYRFPIVSETDEAVIEKPHIDTDTDYAEAPSSNLDGEPDDLTHSFVRLTNLPTYPLDRLSRYEATLWRQACTLFLMLQPANAVRPNRVKRPELNR